MTTKAQWYRINKDVEYSQDFKFFSENQIRIVRTGKRHNFCSRLEAKKFKDVIAVNRSGSLSDSEVVLVCKSIHTEIFSGKHGFGSLVS